MPNPDSDAAPQSGTFSPRSGYVVLEIGIKDAGPGSRALVEGCPLDDSESVLVERARCGDAAAFEALVRQYQDLAFRVAYLIVGSAEDAEDAAQDGFLRAWRALGQFRPGAPLRPWLLTIIANAARTRRSAATRYPTLALNAAAERPSDEPGSSPETFAMTTERRSELLAAVQALRQEDQQIIACRYFLDLSEAETAAVLDCPRGTVKSRLSRALQRLRQRLEADVARGRTRDG